MGAKSLDDLKLVLEDAVQSLGDCILIGVAVLRHADPHSLTLQEPGVGVRTILHTTI